MYFNKFIYLFKCFIYFRERDRDRERETETDRDRERERETEEKVAGEEGQEFPVPVDPHLGTTD